MNGQCRPWFCFGRLGAVNAVVVVEMVEVVDRVVDHGCQIFLQLDLALGAFFEHSRTGALEVFRLRCYETAVDAVPFAVTENGEVRESTIFAEAICIAISACSVKSNGTVDYLCATAWKSSFARVVAMSSIGGGKTAGPVGGALARHLSERKNFSLV